MDSGKPIVGQFRAKLQEYKREYQKKKAEGYDVSQVERLAREARDAHKRGDNQRARQLLREAVRALENAKKFK